MNKIVKIFLILGLLLTSNCGFKPIFIKSNYDFSITIKSSSGSERVNNQIITSLENLNGSSNYQVSIISNEQKSTISKER